MHWKYVIFILSVCLALAITDSRFDYTLSSTRAALNVRDLPAS